MTINEPTHFEWLDEQRVLMRDLMADPNKRPVFRIGYSLEDLLDAINFRVELADHLGVEMFEFDPEIEGLLTSLAMQDLEKADLKRLQETLCLLLHAGIRMGQFYAIRYLHEKEGKTVKPELRYL
jgi:hypothetical protein